METPGYIKALLKPNGAKPKGRRVWSIDLETVWLPFFTATNAMGETAIPDEALGAPLLLAHNADGSVKFSRTGNLVMKIVKDIADSVRLVRENHIAGLLHYANTVAIENPGGYRAQVEASRQAAKPIIEKDRQALENALAVILAQAEAVADPIAEAVAQAQAVAEAVAPKPSRKAKVAEPEPVAV